LPGPRPLLRTCRPGVIDQNTAHHTRRQSEEM
jgi:hypothetical protein